jgi:hypothetical protein
MRIVKRSAAVLGALAVIVLPGGSLVVGAIWLYRYFVAGRAAV